MHDGTEHHLALKTLIETLKTYGIHNQQVLNAIQAIPREKFVLDSYQHLAYENVALPLEENQTISQPYIIALTLQAICDTGPLSKVLEIGTGSGYQTALLSQLVTQVYSIERIASLHQKAQNRLSSLNIQNVELKHDDGYMGWLEEAPFDAIVVSATTEKVPEKLLAQLKSKGRMVIPIGAASDIQNLILITHHNDQYEEKILEQVRFVPMIQGVIKE